MKHAGIRSQNLLILKLLLVLLTRKILTWIRDAKTKTNLNWQVVDKVFKEVGLIFVNCHQILTQLETVDYLSYLHRTHQSLKNTKKKTMALSDRQERMLYLNFPSLGSPRFLIRPKLNTVGLQADFLCISLLLTYKGPNLSYKSCLMWQFLVSVTNKWIQHS